MKNIEEKLNEIEKEITNLKLMLLDNTPKTKVSMKGILKNVKIDENDFGEAKKSLFKHGV